MSFFNRLFRRGLRSHAPRSKGEQAFAPVAPEALEAKHSAARSLISMHTVGKPVWNSRNYKAFAKEGYAANPVGYRCVRMIAEAAASVPWALVDGEMELVDHPLLALLQQPDYQSTGQSFLEEVYGHLLVSGNAYLEVCELDGMPRELHAFRPDRMQVVPGPSGWPERYDYTVNGQTVKFHQGMDALDRPILHLRLFNPLDDHYGLSPFEAAARAVDIHTAASDWNKALLDNAAKPSGALVFKGEDGNNSLNEEQFKRLKQELEQSFQGSGNAGRPMVLEGGLDWKQLSHSPRDMEHIEAKHVAAREIALAFGVPPMLLGIPGDNTYANFAEANRALWRQTVLPLVRRTTQSLSCWLAPRFGPSLKLGINLENIEALSADRSALWARVDAASFLDEDEKRKLTGFAPRQSNREQGEQQ